MMRWFLLALSFVQAFALPATGAEETRPNVLFIAIDDLNTWIGALEGHPQAQTPNIDRLAERGVLFSNAHCAAPACNPSRTAVMTGLRPSTSGVYLNGQDWRKSERLKEIPTLPEHFGNHGYNVLGGGKLYHAASLNPKMFTGYLDPEPWDEFFPSKERQMPDEVLPGKFPSNGTTEFYKGFFDWAELDIEDDEMGDGKVVSWAEEHLSREHEKPLFLAVGIYRPHIPWYILPQKYFDRHPLDEVIMPLVKDNDLDDVPEAGQAMARRNWQDWIEENEKWRGFVRGYLASVSFADAMVGRLLDALDSGPMSTNTIIVLWSDHGYHLGHKEHWEKFALWEQATQVPLIVAAPGLKSAGRCERPVSLIDIYPTLVELTGTGNEPHLEGTSLVPFLRDPKAPSDRAVLITQGFENHAVRSQDFRYIRYADGSEELYDHRTDPNEFTNVAKREEYRGIVQSPALKLPSTNAPLDPQEKRNKKSK